ncbi:hypothetical protein BS47DRAFT_1345396 [Hydnum rufescens UP504]|uniref:Uncharacterized protein n=1 Tax=Hydnum rufescens UP504 TaxID=1448309 RepID=A0A9P6AVD4_9AGAM|nr:hypothetical protein BS47DRAFT_1345396 [Hydnum rufescens UP504]
MASSSLACGACLGSMGVAGLWDLLQHAAETRSLTHLGIVDGFEKNMCVSCILLPVVLK